MLANPLGISSDYGRRVFFAILVYR